MIIGEELDDKLLLLNFQLNNFDSIWNMYVTKDIKMMRSFIFSYKLFKPLSELVTYHLCHLLESRLYKAGSLIWAQNKNSVYNLDFNWFYSTRDNKIQLEAIERALKAGKIELSSFQRILTTYSVKSMGNINIKNLSGLIYNQLSNYFSPKSA